MSVKFDRNYKKYQNEIVSLYFEAFPEVERRDLEEIEDFVERDKGEIVCIISEQIFAGFLILIEDNGTTLLDFFAIKKEMRGKSIGSQAIKKLNNGDTIIIEIEPVIKSASNYDQRRKRRRFYKNLGFESSGLIVNWHNTMFELLSLNNNIGIEEYYSLYDNVFSEKFRKKYISLREEIA